MQAVRGPQPVTALRQGLMPSRLLPSVISPTAQEGYPLELLGLRAGGAEEGSRPSPAKPAPHPSVT